MSRKNSLENKQARRAEREAQWAQNGGRGPADTGNIYGNRAERRRWAKQNKAQQVQVPIEE